MLNPKEVMEDWNSRPPMKDGTKLIFVGLALLFASILLLKITTQDYWWAGIVLAAIVGCKGAIEVSRIPGES